MLDKIFIAFEDRDVKTVTYYKSPTETIRVTRPYKPRKNSVSQGFRVEIGKPNYQARQFIKKCIAAGEPFPVKKLQLKFYPPKAKVI